MADSLWENYFHTTGQYDWSFLNVYQSWLFFTSHIIEYRAKFDKCYLSLWQVKSHISTSRRQVLPDIDLRQTRFCIVWPDSSYSQCVTHTSPTCLKVAFPKQLHVVRFSRVKLNVTILAVCSYWHWKLIYVKLAVDGECALFDQINRLRLNYLISWSTVPFLIP